MADLNTALRDYIVVTVAGQTLATQDDIATKGDLTTRLRARLNGQWSGREMTAVYRADIVTVGGPN
jgi:hypothetical protein